MGRCDELWGIPIQGIGPKFPRLTDSFIGGAWNGFPQSGTRLRIGLHSAQALDPSDDLSDIRKESELLFGARDPQMRATFFVAHDPS